MRRIIGQIRKEWEASILLACALVAGIVALGWLAMIANWRIPADRDHLQGTQPQPRFADSAFSFLRPADHPMLPENNCFFALVDPPRRVQPPSPMRPWKGQENTATPNGEIDPQKRGAPEDATSQPEDTDFEFSEVRQPPVASALPWVPLVLQYNGIMTSPSGEKLAILTRSGAGIQEAFYLQEGRGVSGYRVHSYSSDTVVLETPKSGYPVVIRRGERYLVR